MKKTSAFSGYSAVLSFIIPLAVYLLTACPTVYVGDSGEMITAAYYLGIPHPPGYPLYTMFGKIMSSLPLFTIAYRVNLTASFFGALSVLFSYLLFRKISGIFFKEAREKSEFITDLAALFSSLAVAFSFTFWNQSLMTKGGLYTLNLLIIILALHILLKISVDPRQLKIKNFVLLGIICGLGLANHNTMLPLTLLFTIYATGIVFIQNKKKAFACLLSVLFTAVFSASLLYLYLIIRAQAVPVINWGNPENLQNLIRHISRQQYLIVDPGKRTISHFFVELYGYSLAVLRQNNFLFILFPLGIYSLWKQSKKYLLLTGILFLFTSAGFAVFTNFYLNSHDLYIVDPFLIPSFFMLSLFSVIGLFFIINKLRPDKFQVYTLVSIIAVFSVLLIPFNYYKSDKSKNWLAFKYGANLFKTIKKNGTLFAAGDNATFITCYLSRVEKIRPDLTIYDDTGNVFDNIYGKDFHRLEFGNYHRRLNETQWKLINEAETPVYCVTGSNLNNAPGFKMKPDGVLFRIVKDAGEKTDTFDFSGYDTTSCEDNTFYKDFLNRELVSLFYFSMAEAAFDAGNKKNAEHYYLKSEEFGGDMATTQNNLAISYIRKELYQKAILHSKKALDIDPRFADAYNNLGISYYKLGNFEEAVKYYVKAIETGPRDTYLYNLGQLYRDAKMPDGAIDAYQRALLINPYIPKGNYIVGNAYFDKGEFDKAIEFFLKGLVIEPDSFEIYTNLGVAYDRKNMLNEAGEAFKKAIRLNPKLAEARYGLGSILQKQKDYGGAIKSYSEAVGINQNFAEGWNALGLLLNATGNYKEAINCFKNLAILRPKDVETWNNLGISYGSINQFNEAIKAWEKALSLDPNYTNSKLNIQKVKGMK
ncbi:MAG: tetratricopeptide repeat protein [Candidatus Firestonebacteria bacterium]